MQHSLFRSHSSNSLCLLQIKDRPDAVELVDSKAGYGIQLENVRFGYRPELPILQVRALKISCMSKPLLSCSSWQLCLGQGLIALALQIALQIPIFHCPSATSIREGFDKLVGCRVAVGYNSGMCRHMQGLSLSIPAGTSCALVGTSGSGKSTVLRFLFRVQNLIVDDQTAVQGLSLSIPAGTSCALVGTSGSGKSTVLRLLFRFYEPESGTLSVAGRSITDYTMKSLRAKIGEVGPASAPGLSKCGIPNA